MIAVVTSKLQFNRYVFCACAAMIGAACIVYFAAGGVTRATYNRIRVGMTANEVKKVISRTQDELSVLGYEDIYVVEDPSLIVRSPEPISVTSWSNGWRRIGVAVDGNQVVICKYYQRPPGGWIPLRIIRWISL